ncbi:MAG: type III secretion system chaperone [Achromobacter sp.]|uniref:type III secretion system chaperone n=1 Tax=Achromobacter sp. TaxID=134375 RepID=UPI00258F3F1E|nr:type III secretion system chaperone [Achromobacter sp.]MCW0206419.1 type III secretion system chaperone [Achromobacter sp.]
MNIDTFLALVNAYCTRAGLPPAALENEHCVLLPQPGQAVVLAWDAAEEEVLLLAPVGAEPIELDGEAAVELLGDAYLGQNLAGAAAGIDPQTGGLVLWRRLPGYGLTADRLERSIQRTVAAAQACLGS